MKNRQMRMIVLILVGLVLFTTSIALLMYTKESRLEDEMGRVKLSKVVVSSHDIKKGALIGAQDIKIAEMPQEFVGKNPVTADEVIGRYAVVDIFANEPIRAEKISSSKPTDTATQSKSKEQQELITQKSQDVNTTLDTVSIPMNVFRNIDTSLKAGDFIDLVSVVEKKDLKRRETNFSTKYIALHVKIDAFVFGDKKLDAYVAYNGENTLHAEYVVLAMSPKNIKNFLMLYYKTLGLNANRVYNNAKHSGHLWMVKCATNIDPKTQQEKERMLADYVRQVKRVKTKRKVYKPRPRKKKEETVSISYED